MEHIEEAGVHSGDSACAIPPPTLSADIVATIEQYTRALAEELDVCGLLNVQYAVKDGGVCVIEANPRASRTVPFVSKATGVSIARIAARLMVGTTLAELRDEGLVHPAVGDAHVAVKEAVLPFDRFPDVDTVLGPEMRSTGEVMGIDRSFGLAFAKSQAAAGNRLPASGTVFLSLADRDKPVGIELARRFVELGFALAATAGTARAVEEEGLPVATVVAKVGEGTRRRRRRAHLVREGRPGRQHAARPRAPCRRRPHPARRDPSRCALHHHRSRPPAPRRPASPSGPRTRRASARCRSTTTTPSSASGSDVAPVDTTVRLGDLELPNPIVAASGTFGHGDEVARLCDPARLGAVTSKSQAPFAWGGNPPPRLHPATAGMVNAVGLQGHGVEHWVQHDLPPLRGRGARVIASLWGHTVDDFRDAASCSDRPWRSSPPSSSTSPVRTPPPAGRCSRRTPGDTKAVVDAVVERRPRAAARRQALRNP